MVPMSRSVLGGLLAWGLILTPAMSQGMRADLDVSFLVQSYYFALMPAADDATRKAATERMGKLLAEGANIELKDIDVTQNREEFLESMDQWFDAMEMGRIAYRIEDSSQTSVTTIVCYDFGTSQALNRERFALEAGEISGSVQERIADDCSEF